MTTASTQIKSKRYIRLADNSLRYENYIFHNGGPHWGRVTIEVLHTGVTLIGTERYFARDYATSAFPAAEPNSIMGTGLMAVEGWQPPSHAVVQMMYERARAGAESLDAPANTVSYVLHRRDKALVAQLVPSMLPEGAFAFDLYRINLPESGRQTGYPESVHSAAIAGVRTLFGAPESLGRALTKLADVYDADRGCTTHVYKLGHTLEMLLETTYANEGKGHISTTIGRFSVTKIVRDITATMVKLRSSDITIEALKTLSPELAYTPLLQSIIKARPDILPKREIARGITVT